MESESLTNHTVILVRSSERYTILNGLCGLVLPGIALTNFPEFSLYSLLPVETTSAMPTAGVGRIIICNTSLSTADFAQDSCYCSISVSPSSSPMRQEKEADFPDLLEAGTLDEMHVK